MSPSKLATGLLIGLLAATSSQAASVSYFLDQSSKLADGINYLQVDIADGANGAIDFTVTALQPLLDIAGPGFGIIKFAFNAVPGIKLTPNKVDISSLPKGWVKGPNQYMDGFGRYDMRLRVTTAKTPLTPSISFSVIGIDLDTITSYVDLALNSTEGPSLFSARVAGLALPCVQPTSASRRVSAKSLGCKPTDAFFGGTVANNVPAPPALWLLGTAVAGLAARRLRGRPGAAATV